MLNLESVSLGYGDLLAVKNASLSVKENQVVSLLGSNGAGKTSLIRAISGLLPVRSGAITFEGQKIDTARAHQIVEMGLIQVPEGRMLFPEMTVMENLEMGGYCKRARKGADQAINDVLELFPVLTERGNQLAGTLSGGEQQMLAIGRGLIARPRLLMLDEPSLGLAPLVVREIFKVIQTISQRGCSILLVEQNVMHALSISDYAYVLENGEIVMQGPSKELQNDEGIREAYLGL